MGERSVTVKEPFDLMALLAKMRSADADEGYMSVWDSDIKAVEDAITTINDIRSLRSPKEPGVG